MGAPGAGGTRLSFQQASSTGWGAEPCAVCLYLGLPQEQGLQELEIPSPLYGHLAGPPWLQDALANYREKGISSSNIPASARLPTRGEIQHQFNEGPRSKRPAAAVYTERGAVSAPQAPPQPAGMRCALTTLCCRGAAGRVLPRSRGDAECGTEALSSASAGGRSSHSSPSGVSLEKRTFPSLLQQAPGTRGHSKQLLQPQRSGKGEQRVRRSGYGLSSWCPHHGTPKQETCTCRS